MVFRDLIKCKRWQNRNYEDENTWENIFLFNKTQIKNAFKQHEINMFSKIIFQFTSELGKRTGIEWFHKED